MTNRFPSLDGIRAISILGVIYAHACESPGFPNIDYSVFQFALSFVFGDHGVNAFFVVSGFIITSLLLKEESQGSQISLRNFYIRRALRILPAYFTYLLVIYLVNNFNIIKDLDVRSFVQPLTFTTGTWGLPTTPGRTLGHSWSLSVEEQFYLFWPTLLVIVRSQKWRNVIVVLLILSIPCIRAIYYYIYHQPYYYTFPLRGDCILMGCFLALNSKTIVKLFANRTLQRILLVLLCSCTYILGRFTAKAYLGFITVPLDIFFQGLFFSMIIISYSCIPRKQSFVYKILNLKPVAFIGVLSYSLYIWQQAILQTSATIVHSWKSFPYNIIITFLLAVGSYYLLEKPFLRLRHKFSKV